MKKTRLIAAVLLIAVILTWLAACATTEDIAGTYKLTEATGDGAQVYNSLKDKITLEVKKDGTGTMKVSGNTGVKMTFDPDTGMVTYQNTDVPFTFENNKLTIEDATGKLTFEK